MPVIQIDWETIKTLFADDTEIIALTSRQRALLLSLSEQLHWEKTFRDFGYDWDDKDTLDTEIADLQHNLTMPVNLTDLIGYIDDIESLLTALVNQAGCCGQTDPTDGTWYTDDVVDGVGDVPQNIIDAGYASDVDDWDGFYDYKCMIMHLWVSQVESDLRDLAPYISNGIVIIGGIATVLGAVATIATGGTALAIAIFASAATAGELSIGLLSLLDSGTESLADKIADDHDELVCAMMQADGVQDAFDIWMDLAANYSALEMVVLRNLNVSARLRALYAGRYDQQDIAQKMADNGLDPAEYDCACVETPPAPTGYHLEHPTYNTFAAYLNVASHSESYDESTGLLTTTVTASSGGNLEFAYTFQNIAGHACFYHGYVFELVDFTSACDFYQVYNGKLDCHANGDRDGKTFAGYNTNQHSGSTWDNWTALFDYTGNHSENGFDNIRQRNVVNNCAGYGASHTWYVRVWAVVAD